MRVFEMHERYGDGEIWLLLETKSHSAAKKAKGTANAMLCALLAFKKFNHQRQRGGSCSFKLSQSSAALAPRT
ncbi:hypothetical protein PHAVU_003G250600 [Phaseolus vulgaris]|uniref:Uncharacterized protein n=1 Tax=Phaseolus vulgaris TaxID=3885 RepID=V7CCX2_PHAVU|nr:hypothetical protein PHAVU_003G250600g [Phaseolus vulgaris]ESW27999.1 hypothetical protein PHAVU_003G250600g [Phaseolus vulgaris]